MSKGINNILIPNVSGVPQKEKSSQNKLTKGDVSEFNELLQGELQKPEGIHLSTHAAKRLQERNINIDRTEFSKLNTAMSKLREKGGQDSLIITGNGAYIVDVNNNKIVTAMDKEGLKENVFTKIDSTIFMK